ncbi:MAG: hypothetical protein LBB61_06530 [Treponema sp.]|jgi:hypothetical protein|nr:hypothetical protein [Treponema sp.]
MRFVKYAGKILRNNKKIIHKGLAQIVRIDYTIRMFLTTAAVATAFSGQHTRHRSPITDHRSPITDHRSPITDHRSQYNVTERNSVNPLTPKFPFFCPFFLFSYEDKPEVCPDKLEVCPAVSKRSPYELEVCSAVSKGNPYGSEGIPAVSKGSPYELEGIPAVSKGIPCGSKRNPYELTGSLSAITEANSFVYIYL